MNGWVIGWAIGAAVVVIVVALLLVMIVRAGRAGDEAEEILASLREAQDNTDGLWQLSQVNEAAQRIVQAATDARHLLASGGRRA